MVLKGNCFFSIVYIFARLVIIYDIFRNIKMKPKLRKEAELDLRSAITGAIWAQFNRNDIYPFQSCINCVNFVEQTEKCTLAQQRPPARVIVFGCQCYVDNQEIPF